MKSAKFVAKIRQQSKTTVAISIPKEVSKPLKVGESYQFNVYFDQIPKDEKGKKR